MYTYVCYIELSYLGVICYVSRVRGPRRRRPGTRRLSFVDQVMEIGRKHGDERGTQVLADAAGRRGMPRGAEVGAQEVQRV